jgi:ubiquinone/menaquinone biosynthesis C-methylase UbiE
MEQLAKLKDDWESLAQRDALWAILTDSAKVERGWDIAEFMATGRAEIETVINHLASLDLLPDFKGSALDFGCGVGRLTQPLASRFSSCVGVDISQKMIDEAEGLNQDNRCQFLASAEQRLPFADASFSFIYSNIVLQHMPAELARGYLREFVRVLTDGGVLVFGVQECFLVTDFATRMDRVRQVVRVRSRVRAMLGRVCGEIEMHCLPESDVRQALGNAKVIDVQWTNTAAKDFNGRLTYLHSAPKAGYVSKQYCVVKDEAGSAS